MARLTIAKTSAAINNVPDISVNLSILILLKDCSFKIIPLIPTKINQNKNLRTMFENIN